MIMTLGERIPREIERCIFFIQNCFEYKGFSKAIIGISGGLDSAVVAALCVEALGKNNVTGLMLPYGEQKDIVHSKELCNYLGIKSMTVDISPMANACLFPVEIDKTRMGNITARCRMIVLYDLSYASRSLVVGTSNKTELMMGYFTIHGDGACAIAPIGHLYKSYVKEIAVALKIPKSILEKAPSAGLWDGQTDEEELGITYELLDSILYKYEFFCSADLKRPDEVAADVISTNLCVDFKTVANVIKRIQANEFKLRPPMMMGR